MQWMAIEHTITMLNKGFHRKRPVKGLRRKDHLVSVEVAVLVADECTVRPNTNHVNVVPEKTWWLILHGFDLPLCLFGTHIYGWEVATNLYLKVLVNTLNFISSCERATCK